MRKAIACIKGGQKRFKFQESCYINGDTYLLVIFRCWTAFALLKYVSNSYIRSSKHSNPSKYPTSWTANHYPIPLLSNAPVLETTMIMARLLRSAVSDNH